MTLGIIQARCGSTRFPNKILNKIDGKTILEIVIDRVKQSKFINKVIVATTYKLKDNAIFLLADKNNVKCFRGSENDLIDRYYQCARIYKGDVIVRLGADDVFVDPDIIDKAIQIYYDNISLDFVTNHFYPTYPEGLELELYPFPILAYIWHKAILKSDKEHVFPYLYRNKNKFNICNFVQKENQSNIRLTIDYDCDIKLARKIFKYWGDRKEIPLQNDIIKILKEHPDLLQINNNIERKEGINKSIKEDGGIPIE